MIHSLILASGLAHTGFAIRQHKIGVYITKPLTMILIILLPLTIQPQILSENFQAAIIWGLCLSLLGDVFLMLPDQKKYFLPGLGSFLLAHLCYIGGFWPYIETEEEPFVHFFGVFITLLPLGFFILFKLLWPGLSSLALKIGVSIYLFIILVMVSMAWGLPFDYFCGIGASLFAFSDTCLALREFRQKTLPYSPFWVMGSYFLAQWFLATSVR